MDNLAISTDIFNTRNVWHQSPVRAWYVFQENEYRIVANPELFVTVSPFSEKGLDSMVYQSPRVKVVLFLFVSMGLPVAGPAQAEVIEEVVVTGSHIKGTRGDESLPVTSLARDDLAYEGSPTIIDLIKNLSFSQGADGESDFFQAGAGPDRATANLRGLGPSRTLVLLNGRRTTWSPHAISAQAQLLVDVNMLPSIALERVEILREGAASTYGSDAIAGVMNYITRSDFSGVEVSADYKGIDGSAGDAAAGIILGTDLLQNRGHAVSSFGYMRRSRLELIKRDWAVVPYEQSPLGGWSSIGRPSVVVPLERWQAAPVGGFTGMLASGIVDPNCEKLGGARTHQGVLGNPDGGFCHFQYTPFYNLTEKTERWQWFTELSLDVNDSTTLSAEFLMTDSRVPSLHTSPSYPPNRLIDENRTIRANHPGLVDMASKYPDLYGDYAWCDRDYCRWDGDPGQSLAGIPPAWQEVAWFFGRSYGQDGPVRGTDQQTGLWRANLALDGSFADYDWTVAATWSRSKRTFYAGDTMVYRDARARQGLAGAECEQLAPNQYDQDGRIFFPLETLMTHAGQGPCRYWTPFSNSMAGSHPRVPNGLAANPDYNPVLNNQEIYDYIVNDDYGNSGKTSLLVLDAVFSGILPWWSLPGGGLNFAAGFQWRSETYKTNPLGFSDFELFPCAAGPEIADCTIDRNGLYSFLAPGFPIDEERDIYSFFGELQAPVTDDLEAHFFLRYEDYGGSVGASIDPKVHVHWQALPGIGLRASVGTTFRGPTLNQIVSSNSSNSFQYVAATAAFKRIDTKGNPQLDPEEATTINAGVLIDHDNLFHAGDYLTLSADYWSYDFEKPLVTEPYNAVLERGCPGAVTDPCDVSSPYFERLSFAGSPVAANVEIIDINIINGPDIKTDGIDFSGLYSVPVGPGQFSAGFNGTRILGYDIDAWELGEAYNALGRLNYTTSLARTLVKLKLRGFLNYAWKSLNMRYGVSYADDYVDIDRKIDSHVTHDVHANYRLLQDRLELWVSVVNLLDEDPPFVPREMNYDPFTHDPYGRTFKVGIRYSMGK